MEINKQDEKLLQELLKKYKQGIISGFYSGNNITFTPTGCRDKIISSTSSGIGGGIQSIQEGDNITIDDTDPANPIISATFSGAETWFTGFVPLITTTYFTTDHVNKVLILNDTDVHMLLDGTEFLQDGDKIGILTIRSNCGFQINSTGDIIFPLAGEEGFIQPELVLLSALNIGGETTFGVISSSVINDEGVLKTALKYLYDQSQNAIPLSGTVSGSPVTGDIEIDNAGGVKKIKGNAYDNYIAFIDDGSIEINNTTGSNVYISGIGFTGNDVTGVGMYGSFNYSENITNLDYTQKIYVDTHIAFTTVPSSSTDTGVKGQMAVDANYLYVCVATDTWTRIALSW